jgi:hypothetical protein
MQVFWSQCRALQQYFSYIVVVSFMSGGNRELIFPEIFRSVTDHIFQFNSWKLPRCVKTKHSSIFFSLRINRLNQLMNSPTLQSHKIGFLLRTNSLCGYWRRRRLPDSSVGPNSDAKYPNEPIFTHNYVDDQLSVIFHWWHQMFNL